MHRALRLFLLLLLSLYITGGESQPGNAQKPDLQNTSGNAANAPKRASSSALQYRKIYVPEARLSDVVPKNERYLSIESEEFERLLNLVRAGERGENTESGSINSSRLSRKAQRE